MNPVNIGSRREVFWDDALIETSRTTAQLKLHEPRIEEIVLVHDEPWEGDGCNSYSIIADEGKYRMYYLGWEMMNKECTKHSTKGAVVCYAESTDGIHWVKPNLGICTYGERTDTNIIMDGTNSDRCDMMHFFIDENPACPPEEKYKGIGCDKDKYLSCWISADGIHFTKGWQMTNVGFFDTHNIAFWVPEQNQYIAYIRSFHDQLPDGDWNSAIRDVRWMTSPDFKTWTVPELLDFQGGEDYALYTNEVQRYPRAPHMFIGFPSRYVERKAWTENYDQLAGAELRSKLCKVHPRYGLTVTDCLFMTSRDGKRFHRFDEAWMRPGPERVNNWVYGDCYPATGLVETPSALKYAPAEYSMFCYENHWRMIPAELRRYTIRKDGFCSRSSGYGESKIYTKPIVFDGGKMELNFSTSARGYVYIKVHCQGKTISSCELFGDTLERIVPFDGDLSEFAGKEVTLEFTLRDADLYSFRFFND